MKASLKLRYAVEPRTCAESSFVPEGTRVMRLPVNSPELGPWSRACMASLKGESLASTVRFTSRLPILPSSSTLIKYKVAMRVRFIWSMGLVAVTLGAVTGVVVAVVAGDVAAGLGTAAAGAAGGFCTTGSATEGGVMGGVSDGVAGDTVAGFVESGGASGFVLVPETA